MKRQSWIISAATCMVSVSSVLGQTSQNESAIVVWDDVAPGYGFGASVEVNGPLLVVGAPGSNDTAPLGGSALVYVWNDRGWNPIGDLSDEIPASLAAGDEFGSDVAIAGSWIAVGAPGNDDIDTNAGAIHIFQWDGLEDVSYIDTVYGADSGVDNYFGYTVAMSPNYLIGGSPYADLSETNDGTATVFGYDIGIGWYFRDFLKSPNPQNEELMGISLDITESSSLGTVVIAGASGSNFSTGTAYIFTDDGSGFDSGNTIDPPAPGTGHLFGDAVAIADDRFVVGEPGCADNGLDSGAVWVYEYVVGIGWLNTDKLDPGILVASDRMGAALDMSSETIVIGVPRGVGYGANTGRVDMWTYSATGGWVYNIAYLASDLSGTDSGGVGSAVSISGDRVCGGAPLTPGGGAAYVFSDDREWLNPSGGDWLDITNWSSGRVPDFESRILFNLYADYTVEVDAANAEGSSILVTDGQVTIKDTTGFGSLNLYGDAGLTVGGNPSETTGLSIESVSMYLEGSLMVGPYTGGDALLELNSVSPGASINGGVIVGGFGNGMLSLDNCTAISTLGAFVVGEDGRGMVRLQNGTLLRLFSEDGSIPGNIQNGSLIMEEGTTLNCEIGLDVQTNGELIGSGDISSPDTYVRGRIIANAGLLTGFRFTDASGLGNFYGSHESLSGTPEYALTICNNVQVGGDFAIDVGGEAYIDGGCIVDPSDPGSLQVGDVLSILTAGTLNGAYSVWFVPAINDDAYLSPVTPALTGTGNDASLEVRDLGTTFGFNNDSFGDGESGTPVAVIVDDFDGDTIDDVAVAVSGTSNSIDIWLNDGSGTLCLESQQALPAAPADLTAADFDQDNTLDVAVVIPDNDNALVYINDGLGALSLGATLTTGDQPEGITAFSLDGDNRPDLAVTNYLDNTISTYLNNSTIVSLSFGSQSVAATVTKPKPIKPGGLGTSGDKDDDLVVGGIDGGGSHGNDDLIAGLDSVVLFDTGGTVDDLALLDLDGDGDDDVAVTLSGTDSLAVITNDLSDSGIFLDAIPNASGQSGGNVHAADIDDDGDDDLVLVETDDNTGQSDVVALRNDSPSISRAAPRDRGGCPPGQIADCLGNCVPDFWLGDGYCDDGTYDYNGIPVFFNCAEFGCDGGDCTDCCPENGELPDCNGNCAPAAWIGDGLCDDGEYDWEGFFIYFNCEQYACDFDDCVCTDPTGACCTDSGCAELTEVDCAAANGTYQGDQTTCTIDPCPIDEDDPSVAVLSSYTINGVRGTSTPALVSSGDIDADGATDIVQIQQDGTSYVIVVNTDGDAGSWSPDACCVGDLDGSGSVNVDDLLAIIGAFGACADPSNCPEDLDDNGVVNVDDLLAVIGAYGPC